MRNSIKSLIILVLIAVSGQVLGAGVMKPAEIGAVDYANGSVVVGAQDMIEEFGAEKQARAAHPEEFAAYDETFSKYVMPVGFGLMVAMHKGQSVPMVGRPGEALLFSPDSGFCFDGASGKFFRVTTDGKIMALPVAELDELLDQYVDNRGRTARAEFDLDKHNRASEMLAVLRAHPEFYGENPRSRASTLVSLRLTREEAAQAIGAGIDVLNDSQDPQMMCRAEKQPHASWIVSCLRKDASWTQIAKIANGQFNYNANVGTPIQGLFTKARQASIARALA